LISIATTTTTVCITTSITSTVTTTPLPRQCTNYTLVNDSTRSAGYSGPFTCDLSGTFNITGWFRFDSLGGVILANCAVPENSCSTQASGWYSGVYPSTAGGTTNGTVCFNWYYGTCSYTATASVTNCNGYYVFYLGPPPQCNLRYCTV
jgi:hypothetical protein